MPDYWRVKFAWSNSRYRTWQDCKKQYYFNYIAKWEGMKGSPERDRLYQLSELQRAAFLKGSLIHDAIKQQINNHKLGRPVSAEAARNFFVSELDIARANQSKMIAEAFNGFPIADIEFENMKADGTKQIDNFCNIVWNNYKDVVYIDHEKNDTFTVNDIAVRVRCDFLSKSNGIFVVTDWKTGSEGFDDINNNMQMASYIMWINKKYNTPLDKIKGEVVYLKTCNNEIVEKTENDMQLLADFITKSSKEMLSVSSKEHFPASPGRNCKGCNFATICEEGKGFLS